MPNENQTTFFKPHKDGLFIKPISSNHKMYRNLSRPDYKKKSHFSRNGTFFIKHYFHIALPNCYSVLLRQEHFISCFYIKCFVKRCCIH